MEDKYYKVIDDAIEKEDAIGCYVKDDDTHFSFIPICRNDKFLLAADDEDFSINGFTIFPIKNIVSVDSRNDSMYNYILHKEKVTEQIDVSKLKLDS